MDTQINSVKKVKMSRGIMTAIKFVYEFLCGFFIFRKSGPTVTVYGSARFKPGDKYYDLAVAIGKKLALHGIAVMTGGGPGVMEAANRGAKEVGGDSYGCRIDISTERNENKYLDKNMLFRYFFTRKFMLARFSMGFIALPGGFGTMDEIFEMVTLVKTEKIAEFPIVLIGVEFWQPLIDYLETTFVANGTISQDEVKALFLTDSIDEALNHIEEKTSRINNESKH